MCPDDELLSAYYDNELEPETAASVEASLTDDPEWRDRLEEIRAASHALKAQPEPDFEAAQQRVWEQLRSARHEVREPDVFRKRVSLPMPLAAAAAFILLGAGVLITYLAITSGVVQMPTQASRPAVDREITVRLEDPDEVGALLQALNAREQVRQVTIEMPENARFAYQGEARLIRAVDADFGIRGGAR